MPDWSITHLVDYIHFPVMPILVILSMCLFVSLLSLFSKHLPSVKYPQLVCTFLHLVHSTPIMAMTNHESSNTVAYSIAQCITQCFGQGTMLFLEKILFKLPETTGPTLEAHVCLLHHLWHVLFITGCSDVFLAQTFGPFSTESWWIRAMEASFCHSHTSTQST